MTSELSFYDSEFNEDDFGSFDENTDPQPRKCVWLTNEDIVISGISGSFPESNNVKEFRDNLMNGVDMVTETDRRWKPGFADLPLTTGTLKEIDVFDNEYFNVSPKQTVHIEIQIRYLLECVCEAIMDAGISPQTLAKTRTGVFVGNTFREKEYAIPEEAERVSGYNLTGMGKVMLANRISFFLDLQGPSNAIDTSCSSSLTALDSAMSSIRSGECDRAIVAGTQLCLHPIIQAAFTKLKLLSDKCQVFDANASGYARTEAVAVVLLEKISLAKRVYATVIHSKSTSDGRKPQGIIYPSLKTQATLLSEVYSEANIDTKDLAYLEANGTGDLIKDAIEGRVVTRVLIKNRKDPLLIGSVKSNMGHSEASSGVCSLIKVIIAMEEGVIPANLHYKEPNPHIPALHDGRLKVVTKNTPWKGGIASVSGFGLGGVNVHVILRSNQKQKDPNPPEENLKLFAFSGRTHEAVETMLDHLESNPDHNLYGLLSDMMDNPQYGHPYRGYTILNSEISIRQIEYQFFEFHNHIYAQKNGQFMGLASSGILSDLVMRYFDYLGTKQFPGIKIYVRCRSAARPVWFVFPGMGTQWPGMGKDLMELEIFRKSIMNCAEIIKPFGIDLYDLIMNGNKNTFEQLLNNFVVIAAIQIALVDLLHFLNLKPDGIVGHSVGELGCAYADGSLTAEQTILSAYWRGKCVIDSNLPPGAMAAVGLSVAQVNRGAPSGVVAACHNAIDSVSISGAAETVNQYVEELKRKNIFVREIKSSGFAFHCHYMSAIGPSLLKKLREVIVNPKPRSSLWVSSSVPESNWDSDLAKTCSSEYLVNNLVSPVLFHEAMKHVPKNAILIEIAPHCLLQAILKRSLGSEAIYLGTMKRNHPNNVEYFLTNAGMMYIHGMNPTISKLYPPVSFPVPRQTPMISPYIKWDHSKTWSIPTPVDFARLALAAKRVVDIKGQISEDYFLVDNKIDKRILYPESGYLFNMWRLNSYKNWELKENLPVTIKNVEFHRPTILQPNGAVTLSLNFVDATRNITVSENDNVLASGLVDSYKDSEEADDLPDVNGFEQLPLNGKDIYEELRRFGYEYGPMFQGILAADIEGQRFLLRWDNNWITFIDSMFQCLALAEGNRNLCFPKRIQTFTINPIKHKRIIEALKAKGNFKGIPMIYDKFKKGCVAGGVEITKLQTRTLFRLPEKDSSVLETYQFVPYIEERVHYNLPEFEKVLQLYHDICSSKIMEIKNKMKIEKYQQAISNFNFETSKSKPVNYQEQRRLLTSNNYNKTLFKTLETIFSLPLGSKHSQIAFHLMENIGEEKDLLLTSFFSKRTLKICLDVVMENTITKHLKVLELDDSNLGITEILLNSIKEYADITEMKFSYTKALKNQQNFKRIAEVSYIEWQKNGKSLIGEGFDLIIANGILSQNYKDIDTYLENLKDMMKRGGFLMLLEPKENNIIFPWINEVLGIQQNVVSKNKIQGILERHNLEIVSYKSDGIMQDLYLIKKASLKHFEIINIHEDKIENWLKEVKSKMSAEGNPEDNTLWLISSNQPTNGIIGLTNCLRKEPGGERIRCIFSPRTSINLKSELKNLIRKDLIMNVFKDGQWGSFRHLPIEKTVKRSVKQAAVNITVVGDLSSLTWLESPPITYYSLNPSEKLCDVYYSSLNLKDIMIATGRLPDLSNKDFILGFECSGRDTQGNRVMGVSSRGTLATTTALDPTLNWRIPDNWTMEEAATIPIAYATVYYAFFMKGNLKAGKSILIHSGAGDIGQAAITVALHLGCSVYATEGTQEKRDFLKQRFSALKDKRISSSEDLSFEEQVIKETDGVGVDFVLNSLSDDKLLASLNCLAEGGTFLELGKSDIERDTSLGMSCFLKNISILAVFLEQLHDKDEKEKIKEMITQGIRTGAIQPLNRTMFDKLEVEKAFRYIDAGKHVGKVILKLRDEEKELVTTSKPIAISAGPNFYANPEESFIVTGGLDVFGLELAELLISRKAKHIVLSSRYEVKTGYQSKRICNWRKKGINVIINSSDITTEDGVTSLLQQANSFAPVTGIFHLETALKDGLIENQTIESFQQVINPKVKGARNLDKLSRSLCPNLEYFVVFSSIASGRGTIGQTNYAFANSSIERICELRKKDNLPALAIQWGAKDKVENGETCGLDVIDSGTHPQRIESCLKTLDTILRQDQPVVSSFVKASDVSSYKGKQDILLMVSSILGVKDLNKVDGNLTLRNAVIDSLTGLELQQVFERNFGQILSLEEIRDLTLNKIKEISRTCVQDLQVTEDKTSKDYKIQNPRTKKISTESLISRQCLNALNLKKIGESMFIIHGFEGNLQKLQRIISELDCPVFGIQCTKDSKFTSLTDLASSYIKKIQAVQPKGPYCLAGYTFGMTVALQIAIELQKKQETISHLICLDVNDAYSDLISEKRNNLKSDEDIEIQALCHFFGSITEFHFQELQENLKKITSLEDRLQSILEVLKQRKFQNLEEIKNAAKILLHCMQLASSPLSKKKYQGDALLLNVDFSEEVPNNSINHLKQMINGRIVLKSIEGNIETLTEDPTARKIANLINDYVNL